MIGILKYAPNIIQKYHLNAKIFSTCGCVEFKTNTITTAVKI
jgi:hypothetical protein